MRRVIVLGARGMLGQMVCRYFRTRDVDVAIIEGRVGPRADDEMLARLRNVGAGIVINCIGRIPQKSRDPAELLAANAILPMQIYERLGDGQRLLQPSTDCVFSGKGDRPYRLSDPCDAADDYGWSKRLGEVSLLGKERAAIVRVSIVGTDRFSDSPRGLLGWFLSRSIDVPVDGYVNHYWNGITTLEWCRKVEQLFLEGVSAAPWGRVTQLGTREIVSKHELLKAFKDAFGTSHAIIGKEVPNKVYRVLEAEYPSPHILDQLQRLREFEDAKNFTIS